MGAVTTFAARSKAVEHKDENAEGEGERHCCRTMAQHGDRVEGVLEGAVVGAGDGVREGVEEKSAQHLAQAFSICCEYEVQSGVKE